MEETIKYLSIPIEQFSISSLEDDDRIAKLEMKFMHDKENVNKSFIDLNVIKTALNNSLTSVTGMPILASFNEEGTDFQEHNEDEISIGYIPQINNNLNFKLDEETDKTYVYVDGYIWRHYSKNSIDILEKSKDDGKACSIEIEILDGYRDKKKKLFIITEFKFLGITILGSAYKPGMTGANVKLDYSQKETYINHLKELNEVLNQYFNKKENINDLELINEEESSTKIVSTKEDIKTEFNSENINLNNKEEYEKMTKKEIAEKFSLTYEQLENELRSELRKCQFEGEDWCGNKCLMQRFYLMDYDDAFVYCYDWQNDIYVKISYTKNNDDIEINFEQCSRIKMSPVDWESGSGSDEDENVEEDFVKKFTTDLKDKYSIKVNELNVEIENLKQENKKVTDKFTSLENTLEEKNKYINEKETELFTKDETIASKDEIIANYTKDLEEFKEYKQAKVKQEVMANVETLYGEYSEFISDEDKDKFNEILKSCENFETFSFEDFEAKVTKAIAPKMKAQLFAIKQNNSINNDNRIDVSLMGLNVEDIKSKKTSKSSLEQLEEYVQQ